MTKIRKDRDYGKWRTAIDRLMGTMMAIFWVSFFFRPCRPTLLQPQRASTKNGPSLSLLRSKRGRLRSRPAARHRASIGP